MKWVLVIVLWMLWTGVARGEVVGVVGRAAGEVLLVGGGGEIYARGEDGVWRRGKGGGVAQGLVAAWGRVAKDVWAMGAAGPPYHHDGAAWSAAPMGRRRNGAFAGPGAAVPAFAVSKRVYVWKAGDWQELPNAPRAVAAVWAGGAAEVVIATQDGKMWSLAGSAWRPIAWPRGVVAEPVAALAGSGKVLLARTTSGSLLLVERGARRSTKLDARARLLGGAGFVVTDTALARVDRGKLVTVEELPAATAEPAALLAADDGAAVLVTRGGQVLRRGAKGGWTVERVDFAAPLAGGPAANPPVQLTP